METGEQVVKSVKKLLADMLKCLNLWNLQNRSVREEYREMVSAKYNGMEVLVNAGALGSAEKDDAYEFLFCTISILHVALILGPDNEGRSPLEETQEIVDQIYSWTKKLYEIRHAIENKRVKLLLDERTICQEALGDFNSKFENIFGVKFRMPSVALVSTLGLEEI